MNVNELINHLLPYLISMGIIIYSAMLIEAENEILKDTSSNSSQRKEAIGLQGFAIALLCLGLVVFIATVNNRHPGILEGFRIFAEKGGAHPTTKYLIIAAMLALCITMVVETHNQSGVTHINIINYIIIGVIGLFFIMKGYQMVVVKKAYRQGETSL